MQSWLPAPHTKYSTDFIDHGSGSPCSLNWRLTHPRIITQNLPSYPSTVNHSRTLFCIYPFFLPAKSCQHIQNSESKQLKLSSENEMLPSWSSLELPKTTMCQAPLQCQYFPSVDLLEAYCEQGSDSPWMADKAID